MESINAIKTVTTTTTGEELEDIITSSSEKTTAAATARTILMGYRASKQASTKQSPYYMLHEQHMRLPIDAELMPAGDQEDADHETVISHLLESRKKVFKQAESNITTAQQQQKETYDRKHCQDELAEGTKVSNNNY